MYTIEFWIDGDPEKAHTYGFVTGKKGIRDFRIKSANTSNVNESSPAFRLQRHEEISNPGGDFIRYFE
jgi:hypothetical protein